MSRLPQDHGWSWMICLGTGVQAFFVIGGLKSMGVLFVEIIDIFDASRTVTSMTLGFVAGGFAVFAMLTNAMAMIVGLRTLAVSGAVMFSMSIFLSMFKVHIWYTVLMLGLLSGIAFGAMLTPAIILLTMYFDKRRAFSNGLAMTGSSIGQLTLPYLTTYLMHEYGFSGGMLIYTGIAMHSIPAALLLRPVSFWDRKRKIKNKVQPNSCQTDIDVGDGIYINSEGSIINIASEDSPCIPIPGHKDIPNTQIISGSSKSLHSIHSHHSVLEDAALSLIPGASTANLSTSHLNQSPNSIYNTPSGHKILCVKFRPISCKRFYEAIFDPELMKSPTLWLLFFALGLGHAGFIDALLHLPALALDLFHDKYKGALLVAVAGLFDLGGRIGGGWFADLGYLHRTTLINIGFGSTGLATILMTFYPSLEVLLAYCVVMGLLGGLYRILMPVVVGDLFGREKTRCGIGMLFMSIGVVVIPVPPLLGYIRQVYGSYLPAMQLCGAFLLVAVILLIILRFVQKHDPMVVKNSVTTDPQSNDIKTDIHCDNTDVADTKSDVSGAMADVAGVKPEVINSALDV